MSRYRIIVAGCGVMARQWIRYVQEREDAEIVGLVDINPRAASATAKLFGLECGQFVDLAQAIRTTAANLVFDVTIPAARKQTVLTAVREGCDVFAEKPLAPTTEVAQEIIDKVSRSGRKLFIMQNRRYLRSIRALRRLLQDGVIGTPGFMNAQFFLGPHFGGFREQMDSPLILDMAIHTFDQARFIMNADPVSVYCQEFNPPGSWYAGNAAAACIFEMDNGTVFSYNGSWCAEGAPTSWESEWRITGSIGSAIWSGDDLPYAEIADRSKHKDGLFYPVQRMEAIDEWDGREGHAGCLDAMFAALLQNREAETTYTDNIKSIRMVFAALESAASGRKVQITT